MLLLSFWAFVVSQFMSECRDYGLLLRRIPYGDTSLVLHLLTKEQGRIALMARGARRVKNPLRAALAPMHILELSWRPGRTGMGTLTDVSRGKALLEESKMLAGLEVAAIASSLFQDGDPHGFEELFQALELLDSRSVEVGTCAAIWLLLEQSGWVGELNHCWQCALKVESSELMYWHHGHIICHDCGRGMQINAGLRKSVAGVLTQPNVQMNSATLSDWQRMIQDVLRMHKIRWDSHLSFGDR
ncbi:MAG: DNA repair protein RecO [Mariprofundaceae bacterium]